MKEQRLQYTNPVHNHIGHLKIKNITLIKKILLTLLGKKTYQ